MLYCGIGIVDAAVTVDNVLVDSMRRPDDIMKGPIAPDRTASAQAINDTNAFANTANSDPGFGIVAAGKGPTKKNLIIRNSIIQDFQRVGVAVLPGINRIEFTGNTVTGSGGTYLVNQAGMEIESLNAVITGNSFNALSSWNSFVEQQNGLYSIAQGVYVTLTPVNAGVFNAAFLNTLLNNNTFSVTNVDTKDLDTYSNTHWGKVTTLVYYLWNDLNLYGYFDWYATPWAWVFHGGFPTAYLHDWQDEAHFDSVKYDP